MMDPTVQAIVLNHYDHEESIKDGYFIPVCPTCRGTKKLWIPIRGTGEPICRKPTRRESRRRPLPHVSDMQGEREGALGARARPTIPRCAQRSTPGGLQIGVTPRRDDTMVVADVVLTVVNGLAGVVKVEGGRR
jgi:hypothetical protein